MIPLNSVIEMLALFPLVMWIILCVRVRGGEHFKNHNKNASYIIMWRSNI